MKKNKEHKKGESTIGKIIYGFLLFMPLFAIGVTCGYIVFNKNAYKSYGDSFLVKQDLIYDNDLIENQDYMFNHKDSNTITSASPIFYYNDINIDWHDYTVYYNNQINGFNFYAETSNNKYRIKFWYDEKEIGYSDLIWGNTLKTFTINYKSKSGNQTAQPNYLIYLFTYETAKLSNVFYYSVNKVTESPLFSWATNSVIYTTMNATCTQLSITAPFIPLLLSYWLIISVIYFLYDIALMLIWLLHDKIHETRDSLA